MNEEKPGVLIVDDFQNWRTLYGRLLSDECSVVEAERYEEAITAIQVRRPPFHVAVLDLRLVEHDASNIDGLRIVDQLSVISPTTTPVLITSHGDLNTAAQARHRGTYAAMDKYSPQLERFDENTFMDIVRDAIGEAERRRGEARAFVVMPFAKRYTRIYGEVVKPTIERAGFRCIRADEFSTSRRIMTDVQRSIARARVVVADLSGRNANVLYEVGMAHALGKPVVLMTDRLEDAPPILRDLRTIMYENSLPGVRKLKEELEKFITRSGDRTETSPPLYIRDAVCSRGRRCLGLVPSGAVGRGVYSEIIRPVMEEAGFDCNCPHEIFSSKKVMDPIWQELQCAEMVVADLSGHDSEVFYLTGMSHGLWKKVVLLLRCGEEMPFDLIGLHRLPYTDGSFEEGAKAKEDLKTAVEKVLQEDG
jgi:FixJ family two-component response regulator